ncbi:MAG: OmpA family protein [Xanthobacteraceae bacterium]
MHTLSRFAKHALTHRNALLAATIACAFAFPQWSSASAQTGAAATDGRVILAQKEDPKKKKAQPQKKAPPKGPGGSAQPQKKVPPKAAGGTQPQKKAPPKGAGAQPQKKAPPKAAGSTQPPKKQVPPKGGPGGTQPQKKQVQPKDTGKQPQKKQVQPKPPAAGTQPQKKQVQPKGPGGTQPQKKQVEPKAPAGGTQQKQVTPKGPGGPGGAQFVQPKGKQLPKGNVKDVKAQRKERTDASGARVISEPGNRTIIFQNNRRIIRYDDSARLRRWGNARFETRGRDRYSFVRFRDYEVVTVTDANGRILRRYRRYPGGREVFIINNRRYGGGPPSFFLNVRPPVVRIPRARYIVGLAAAVAAPALLYETLSAPPIEAPPRLYSLDEIRYNAPVREYVRSVDINTINFATGSWEVTPDQTPQLQALAQAILKVVGENPSAVFLIEGHTDAVGTPEDNLSLSDRRAESIAEILTANFQVPPENLVTQGYGEQNLKVPTQGPSAENRRVVVRNVTGLLDTKSAGPIDQPPPGGQPPG